MAGELRRALGATSLLALLVAGSAALAQTERPWVDPPSETEPTRLAPSSQAPSPAQVAVPTAPSTPLDPEKTAPAKLAAPQEGTSRIQAQTAVRQRASMAKTPPQRKVASERRTRDVSSKAIAARPKLAEKAVTDDRAGMSRTNRQRLAGQAPVASRLEVMTLRTIEFPDGRRMNVLVRPNAEVARDLLDDPY
jgi:hypothetical protein